MVLALVAEVVWFQWILLQLIRIGIYKQSLTSQSTVLVDLADVKVESARLAATLKRATIEKVSS